MASVGASIAKYQSTNGGPVILLQAENEFYNANVDADTCTNYTSYGGPYVRCEAEYMQGLLNMFRVAGIVVLFIDNDSGAPPKGRIFATEWRFEPGNSTMDNVGI